MVFTQQVLAKALNEMVCKCHLQANTKSLNIISNSFFQYFKIYQVDRDHLPLLFMRTVIQAIDAFPKLVCYLLPSYMCPQEARTVVSVHLWVYAIHGFSK